MDFVGRVDTVRDGAATLLNDSIMEGQMTRFQTCASISFSLILSFTLITGEATAEKRKGQKRRTVQSSEDALAQPCRLNFEGRERITLGDFINEVAEAHGLQIRIDKTLAGLFVAARESMLVAENEIPGPPKNRGDNEVRAVASKLSIPLPVQVVPVYSQTNQTAGQPTYSLAQTPPPINSAYPASTPYTAPVAAPGDLGNSQPIQPTVIEAQKPVVAAKGDNSTSEEEEEELVIAVEENEEPKQLQLNSRVIEMLLETEISTIGLNTADASLESVLTHALERVTTLYDAMMIEGEMPIPFTYTHAYDLTLLLEKDHVVITTVMAANLKKTTKVYSVKHLNGIEDEALMNVITKTIRPWSWRSQINSLVEQVSADLPETIEIPNIKFNLAGVVAGAENTSDSSESGTTTVDLAMLKAMGQLASSGAVAAAHTLISGTEMMHYADPPNADIELLPDMLVITQSQGAHREIQDLLDQLEAATEQAEDE